MKKLIFISSILVALSSCVKSGTGGNDSSAKSGSDGASAANKGGTHTSYTATNEIPASKGNAGNVSTPDAPSSRLTDNYKYNISSKCKYVLNFPDMTIEHENIIARPVKDSDWPLGDVIQVLGEFLLYNGNIYKGPADYSMEKNKFLLRSESDIIYTAWFSNDFKSIKLNSKLTELSTGSSQTPTEKTVTITCDDGVQDTSTPN